MLGKWVRAAVAAAIALGVVGASGQASAQQAFRIIVTETETPLVPNSVIELALQLGYFAREGVNVELVRVQQTPSAVATMVAGRAEMANIAVDAVIQGVARGVLSAVAVMSPNKSLPFLIAARTTITSPTQLIGRRFGIGSVGSLDHSLSTAVFASVGVDINRLSLVALGQPAIRAQALAAGQVDATTMSIGTWLALPDKTGLHVLIDQDAYYQGAPIVNKVNIVLSSVLQSRRADVEAVVRAIVKISRDFARDPALWVAAMQIARPDVPLADLQTLAASFAGSWSVNGGLNGAELQATSDFLYRGPDFEDAPRIGLPAWVDFSVLDKILGELGVAPGQDAPGR